MGNAVSEMQTINSKDQTVKRGLEASIHTISAEIDATLMAAKNAEEKSKKAMIDASRLADELRAEQDHTTTQLAQKRSAEATLTELESKLANAEAAADVAAEVEASQTEGRNYSSELFRLKAAQDEAVEHLDIVKRENKNLADEIKDLLDQLGEGGRSIHDLDKQRRNLEQEKEELQTALEEAEGALEQEENKVLRAALELSQVRQEIDRRVAEKEEEFASTRKNHARAMDSLGASLEAEQRAKADALRIKKKLEGEINELEIGLDHANKANNEGLKAIKRYQGQLKETIQAYEDQARLKQQITEQVGINERKAGALVGELEESRALLDGAERSKRQIDAEIASARNAVSEMQTINSKDQTVKRGLEASIHTVSAEIDATLMAAKNAEEKSKKAMMDASRLADELRA